MKTLPSLRIAEKSFEEIECSLKKINDESLIKLSRADFIRLAIEYFNKVCSEAKSMGDILQILPKRI